MIRKGILQTRDGFTIRCLGGPGSGNFGHAGIPGQVGGSSSGGGGGGSNIITQNPKKSSGDVTTKKLITRGYTEQESKVLLNYKYDKAFYTIAKDAINGNITEDIKILDSAIDRSEVGKNLTLYHGMGPTESKAFGDVDVGTEFINKSYYSTSLDEDVAIGFADDGTITSENHVLKISLPSGSKAFCYNDSDYENEVILPRNQKFKVDKVTHDGLIHYYYVSPVGKL